MIQESYRYIGIRQYHGIIDGKPYCPKCGSSNVLEQGYEHNHRHYCRECNIIYWLTQS
jgi:ribosomal protein S27AE